MLRVSVTGLVAGLAVAASAANAATSWSYLGDGDAGFNALTNNGSLERAVTEGRIGNNALSGTWELAIWQQGGVGTPEAQAQLQWGNGQASAFSIAYDGISNGGANFGAFTINGKSTFDWGVQPSNSALAYQFKFTNVIPTPGALALLGLAGLAGGRRRRS